VHAYVSYKSAARKVSSHFEYLENGSRDIDVTWHLVRGNLTVHPWTVTLLWGSQPAVRRCWRSLYTVWLSHSQISRLSTAILALGKSRIRRETNLDCRGADRPGWCDSLPEKKTCTSAVEWAGALSWWSWYALSVIVNTTVTQHTSSVNGVSLPTD